MVARCDQVGKQLPIKLNRNHGGNGSVIQIFYPFSVFSILSVSLRLNLNQKTPDLSKRSGVYDIVMNYLELETRLAWLAPFLILVCLIQLMVERSFSPTFSI